MNPEMMEALQALAVDRGISVDALFAALADALESAYKRGIRRRLFFAFNLALLVL